MPTPPTPHANRRATTDENAASAVARALAATSPIVSMWRDGLTVIALGSALENRAPDYLTFDQATGAAALDIHEAPAQTVPTVEAITGKAPVPQSKKLKLSLNLSIDELDDPRGWGRDVSGLGHWGNGDVEITVESPGQIEYAMGLIHQAYEKQAELPES